MKCALCGGYWVGAVKPVEGRLLCWPCWGRLRAAGWWQRLWFMLKIRRGAKVVADDAGDD